MKTKMKFSAQQIAVCGVLLAVSLTALYLSSFVPGVESTLMAVAGALVYIVSVRLSSGVGIAFYVASVLLALLIVPAKPAILPYVFSFGPYGLLKSPAEKLVLGGNPGGRRGAGSLRDAGGRKGLAGRDALRIVAAYALKAAAFAVTTGAGLLIFKEAFFSAVRLPGFAAPLLVVGALALFVIYDYILELANTVIGRRMR
jgi:hypothetical protein